MSCLAELLKLDYWQLLKHCWLSSGVMLFLIINSSLWYSSIVIELIKVISKSGNVVLLIAHPIP